MKKVISDTGVVYDQHEFIYDQYKFIIEVADEYNFLNWLIHDFHLYVHDMNNDEYELYHSNFGADGILNVINGIGVMPTYISDHMEYHNSILKINIFDIDIKLSGEMLEEFKDWVSMSVMNKFEMRLKKINDILGDK